MRRADRLFRIVEYLKSRRTVVRAQELADLNEVSLRTIYRDMADLMGAGTPIIGEAGTGYVLDKHYIVKPLMFDLEELDALALGAQMVECWGDPALSKAAQSAFDKIRATLPAETVTHLEEEVLFSPPTASQPAINVDFTSLRHTIRTRKKVEFEYTSLSGQQSKRVLRPLALAFFAPNWLLLGWCESRNDFRNFRLDKMENLVITDQTFSNEKGKRLQDFKKRELGK